ncbi:MAG: metal ABC transporter substrate-binding protein [Candidatus Saccharibacteria bacterium]|nr:metal ABC transporter substrate-binding protein [Candidatus Saccharibacteria bacterium]
MRRIVKIIAMLVLIMAVLVAITAKIRQVEKGDEAEALVVVTNFPAYDFVRAIIGKDTGIKMLIQPGVEIHTFEPTPQDIIDIQNSNLFIYNGGESDEWVRGILGDVRDNGVKVVRMMEAVEVVQEECREGMECEDDVSDDDEHVWTSLRNVIKIIDKIKNELVEIMPEKREEFERNAEEYVEKLNKLDQEFKEVVDEGKRKVVIFGDRFPFSYFVNDYGLDYYAAFSGCSEQTEASSRTVAFLVDKVREEGVPVILKVEMSDGRIARAIAEETGAKVLEFNSVHNISMDEFRRGVTYAGIMTHNLGVLKEALGE